MARNSPLVILTLLLGVSLAEVYSFDQCEADVQGILASTVTISDISNETIGQYIYHGPVTGLKPDFPRSQYFALTYHGKFLQALPQRRT
jgi:hypothetical protein